MPGALRPEILAQLGRLGARVSQAPPVTLSGGGGHTFSAAGETSGVTVSALSDQALSRPVTHSHLSHLEAMHAAWEERAAILEYDGGWPRHVAESWARQMVEMLARLADPAEWAAMDADLLAQERPSE